MSRQEWMMNAPAELRDLESRGSRKTPLDLAKKPQSTTKPAKVNDSGLSWQARKIERAYEQAKEERRSIEEVALDRFGSIEEFRTMEREVEEWKKSTASHAPVAKNSGRKKYHEEELKAMDANKLAANAIKSSLKGDFKNEEMFKRRLDQQDSMSSLRAQEKKSDYNMNKEFVKGWNKAHSRDLEEIDDSFQINSVKKQKNREHKVKEKKPCWFCAESMDDRLVISQSSKAYVAFPKYDLIDADGHFLLIPMEHVSSSLFLDVDALDELRNYKKCVIRKWAKENRGTIFIETCLSKANDVDVMYGIQSGASHCFIEAISVPSELFNDAKMYFKKAFTESGSEWCDNPKLIEMSHAKRLVNCIPKNFPFVAVTFGLDDGYVHPIDNVRKFDPTFAKSLVASMLGLRLDEWKDKVPSDEAVSLARKEFRDYDWSVHVK